MRLAAERKGGHQTMADDTEAKGKATGGKAGAGGGGKLQADGGAAASAKTDGGRDWGETLYLPKTDFPMRAGLPELEPRLLQRPT